MKKVLGSVIAMVFSAALCFSSVLPAQAAENIEEAIIPEVAPVIEKSETDTVAKNAARGSVDGDSEITWTENTFPASIETTNYSLKKRAYLTSEQDGFMRVAYDGKSIVIEYYDEDFQMVKQGYLPMELDQWGGFYKGEDSYYIVEGHINKDCIDDTEVVRIIKYDFDWNRLGAGSVLAKEGWEYEIRKPFLYSCVNMCEVNGKLYVVTGREGYVDENYGMGHQGMMLIRMDEDTYTTEIVYGDFFHSFSQYLVHNGTDLYVGELSEGGLCTTVSRFDTNSTGTDYFTAFSESTSVLDYGGAHTSAWAIAVYASVDDMAISSDNIMCLGTSIDQNQYDEVTSDTALNVYLTVTPISDLSSESTSVKWLTEYSGDGKCFYGTRITKVNDDRFLIIWEEVPYDEYSISLTNCNDTLSCGNLHYVFVDGSGNKVSKEFTAQAMISDCHPILKDGKIIYFASTENCLDFYTIDTQTGDFSKSVTRIAGNNVSWDFDDGILKFHGKGGINVPVDLYESERVPEISTHSGDYFPDRINCWKYLRNNVNKITIGKGITSIPEQAFVDFYTTQSITLPQGLKSIGKEAFYGTRIEQITIPNSVENIGEDILWSGFHYPDGSPLTFTTIVGDCNSFAIKYALKNDISYKERHTWNSVTKKATTEKNGQTYKKCERCGKISSKKVIYYPKTITLSNTTFTCNGNKRKPRVTVTGSDGKVIAADNYSVTYSKGCTEPGTYSVKVTFKGSYEGSVIRKFKIVPITTTIKKLTPKSRSFTVEWVKQPLQTTGYQIQYSTDSKFKSNKKTITVKGATTTSKKITGLQGGKKYYVRMRTYSESGKTKYYSSWSKLKTTTVKK